MTRAASEAQKGPWILPREPLARLEPGLPAAWYHDAAHHARELEVFWYGMWIAAAREEEIPAAQDYRVVAVGTQSVLIVRDAQGRLRAFHNTCRHRGSILCADARGRLAGGRIVCPYHAWTYALDGSLVATPRRMDTPGFDRAAHALHEIAAATWGGFVFVHFAGAGAPPLAEALADIPTRFERHGLAGLRIGRRIELEVRANWKLLAENFAECYHCPKVHPEFCAVVPAYAEAGAWGLRGAEARPEYMPGAQSLTPDGSARLPPLRGLNEADRAALYTAQTFPPNLFLNVHPDYVNAQMMFPTGPESVRMVYDWLFEADRLPMPPDDLDHYVRLWDLTNRQDARNCELQQRGVHSREFAHGHYVPQEFDCHRFAGWVRSALG